MLKIVSLAQARLQFSALVEEAAAGQEIIIAKAGVPRARLVSIDKSVRRQPGTAKGEIRISKDFDAPLPADLLALFTGNEV